MQAVVILSLPASGRQKQARKSNYSLQQLALVITTLIQLLDHAHQFINYSAIVILPGEALTIAIS
jgi:hypothetical protein